MTLLPAVLSLLGDRVNWPYLSRIPTLVVFIAMMVGGGVLGGVLGAALGTVGPSSLGAVGFMVGFVAGLVGVIVLVSRMVKRGRFARYSRPEGSSLSTEGGFWDHVTRVVMGRPVVWLAIGVLVMITLSLPYWFQRHPDGEGRGIKTGLAGISTLPRRHPDQGSVRRHRRPSSPRAGAQSSVDIVVRGRWCRHGRGRPRGARRTRTGVRRCGGHHGGDDRR